MSTFMTFIIILGLWGNKKNVKSKKVHKPTHLISIVINDFFLYLYSFPLMNSFYYLSTTLLSFIFMKQF